MNMDQETSRMIKSINKFEDIAEGGRQVDPLPRLLFIILLENIMPEAKMNTTGILYKRSTNDDIVILDQK